MSNITRRGPVPPRAPVRGLRPLPRPRLQPLRPDRHRQPEEQHLRVQGLQEQDANLAGQAALRGQAALPGADGHEHRAEDDGDMSEII